MFAKLGLYSFNPCYTCTHNTTRHNRNLRAMYEEKSNALKIFQKESKDVFSHKANIWQGKSEMSIDNTKDVFRGQRMENDIRGLCQMAAPTNEKINCTTHRNLHGNVQPSGLYSQLV